MGGNRSHGPVSTRRGSGERVWRPGTAVVLGRDGGLFVSTPRPMSRSLMMAMLSGRFLSALIAREIGSAFVGARSVRGRSASKWPFSSRRRILDSTVCRTELVSPGPRNASRTAAV